MGNRILLADKSITIQKIVQLTFADDNYQIHCVSDGQAALEAIPQLKPDLILADISLPLRTGYEICATLRADPQYSEFARIPVILLAGIYETMDEERARQVEEKVRQVEATDFLSKPFDPQLLISKVKHHLSSESVAAPVLSEEPESAIHLFDQEGFTAPSEVDNEKTMMLPKDPFGSIFPAAAPPVSPAQPAEQHTVINPEMANPVGEVIFNEEEFPQVELGSEEESQETVNIPSSQEDLGEAFGGREEQEFEFPGSDLSESSEVPIVAPEAEEPFGDVFSDAAQNVQWGSASEEDSPFGVPEPPPAPEPAPVQPPALEFVESKFFGSPESAEKPVEIPGEIEGFDDTWPGVQMKSNFSQPVDELFETEVSPALAEDAEELQADLSEGIEEEPLEAAVEPVETPEQPVATADVTEELINRIAERVVNKLSERVVSEIVWQVVPDLAEKMIRRELEKLHAAEE